MDKKKADKLADGRYFWSEMSANNCVQCNKHTKCDKCCKCKKDKKCDKPNKYDNCDIIKYICCLFEQQKDSLKNIKRILRLLSNSKYGLEEIKTEVAAIEEVVLNPDFDFGEIKAEISAIEGAVLSPDFGLEEIKAEISAIEGAVLSPDFGLEEIKAEVSAVEGAVLSPDFGLEEIGTEIVGIIDSLDNLVGGDNFTTGAFVLDDSANSIILNLLNRSGESKTVTVNRLIFNPDGTINDTLTEDIAIEPNETVTTILPISTEQDLAQIEIQLLGMVDGIYAWIGARTQDDSVGEFPSTFIDSSIFTNKDLSSLVTP